MQYKLKHGEDPFESNPGLHAIAEFECLTPRQMFFVILVADSSFDNPLKTFPDRIKREKAAKICGWPQDTNGRELDRNGRDVVNGKIESVEKAIEKFRYLTFDEDKENLRAVEQQIAEARDFMQKIKKVKDDPKLEADLIDKGLKIGTSIEKLMESKKNLIKTIQLKEPVKIEGVSTFTAVDLAPVEGEEVKPKDEELSTIDRYMQTKV